MIEAVISLIGLRRGTDFTQFLLRRRSRCPQNFILLNISAMFAKKCSEIRRIGGVIHTVKKDLHVTIAEEGSLTRAR